MKKILLATSFLTLFTACSQIPLEAHTNRGNPENLLDQSTEVVNIPLTSPGAVAEITDWVNQDQPTRAELTCMETDKVCADVQQVLEQFGVPVQFTAAADSNASLVYERVLARDCQNRFVDNSINPYNLNHPTFGCSVSSNTLQMVSDKQQFTHPALLDYSDAVKPLQAYDKYAQPPAARGEEARGQSLLETVKSE